MAKKTKAIPPTSNSTLQEQTYTVGQMAHLSGVSVRTLHHYEDLGLLCPLHASNGYRTYTSDDVARLQQILLYKEFGLELSIIKAMLDAPDFNVRKALAQHLESLQERKQQLETLIATVQKTIASLEGSIAMTDKEKFEGLKRKTVEKNEQAFGQEARKRWGDDMINKANEKLLSMDEASWNSLQELEESIIQQLQLAMQSGEITGPEAQELVSLHTTWIRTHWPEGAYSREAHLGLAQGYLADERFCTYYDSRAGEGATNFLVEVLEANL